MAVFNLTLQFKIGTDVYFLEIVTCVGQTIARVMK